MNERTREGAVILLENSHGQIAMQLRDNNPHVAFANHWGLFGGWLETGETPAQAILREVDEELCCQLNAQKLAYIGLYVENEMYCHVFHYLVVDELDHAQLCEGQAYAFFEPTDGANQRTSPLHRRILTNHPTIRPIDYPTTRPPDQGLKTMNGKERVLATLNRQPTDRTPLDCMLYQKQFVEMLNAEYGSREAFLNEYNIDMFIGFVPYPNQLGKKVDVPDLAQLDLGDPRDPKWISFTDWNPDFAGVNVVEAVAQQGSRRAIVAHLWGIVEGTSTFLGIENCWANLALEPDKMHAWFDRYADWLCGLADGCIDAGVDIVTLSDDWGSNQNMLFSPRMWRKMIKPYAMRVAQHIRGRGIHVNLHSDGYILNVMDDIIEMGYTLMHPVQESAGMDPRKIKDEYGDKIVIYGSLDVVDGLYGHEGEELDRYIEERFAIYAPGGGFIFNTGHFVQPDIPPQRLQRAYRLANQLAEKYK